MADEASFHLKPVTSPAASVAHNTRTWSDDHPAPGYLLPPEHRLENVTVIQGDVAGIHAAKMAMASGKARSMPEYSPVWDGVLNLRHGSGLTRERYADQVRAFVAGYEQLTGHRVLAAVVHLDEGRVEHGTAQRNTHAHVTVDRTDDRGRPIRLNKDQLRQVQDLAAETTGLPRGKDARETGLKHLPHQAYRALAKTGRLKTRWLIEAEADVAAGKALTAKMLDEARLEGAELYGEVRGLLKASGTARQEDYQQAKAHRENQTWMRRRIAELTEACDRARAAEAEKRDQLKREKQTLQDQIHKQGLALTRTQQRQDARLAAKARPEAQEPQKPEQPPLSPPSPSQGPRGGGRGF